jgi:hypothetical protein
MLLQTNTILLFANTMLLKLQKHGQNTPKGAKRNKKGMVLTTRVFLYSRPLSIPYATFFFATNAIVTFFMLVSCLWA